MTTRISSAAGIASRAPSRGSPGAVRLEPTARSRQISRNPWKASRPQMTSDSRRLAPRRAGEVVRTMKTTAASAMSDGRQEQQPAVPATGDQMPDTGDDRVEDRRDPASAARRFSGRQRARVVIRHRRRVPRFAPEGWRLRRRAAVECPPVIGAWLNGRAPDSGSGGSRFESWRASHPLPCLGPSPASSQPCNRSSSEPGSG